MNIEEHLLTCLNEECMEILIELAKVCSKSNRFGLRDVNFLAPDGPDNRQRLIDELNDLEALKQMLVAAGVIPTNWQDSQKILAKIEKVGKMMDLARKNGALSE